MKNKTISLMVIFIAVFCVFAFSEGSQEAPTNSSSSRYLFEQNFIENPISKVGYDYGRGDTGYYIPNIGFSAAKRIIYNGFISLLDDSDSIPESAYAVLTKDELRLLRNTVYAKYGMIFQSDDLKSHFQKFSWYNPTRNNVESQLRESDKRFLRTIQTFEDAVPISNFNKRNFVGFWVTPTDAWKGNEITVNENDTIIADLQEDDRRFDWNWKGSYRIESGFLVVLVNEQYVGTPDYLLKSSWRWPDGVTYSRSRGTVVYREPIRLVFPLARERAEWGDFRIGTIIYGFSTSSLYHR
jgi:hypothetical protein